MQTLHWTLVWCACTVMRESTVAKIKAKVGDSVNMSWNAPYFPSAGAYTIYHMNRSIITVTATDAKLNESKYLYTSESYNSTNISFSIRDITLQDAGYYAGGISSEAAWSGEGVGLIVLGKPTIHGNLNIPVGKGSDLTCSSNLSVTPNYYAEVVNMTYAWFANDTKLNGATGQTLRLNVNKNHRYNRYTCTARDGELESNQSEPVQINPLYKPDNLTITPTPPSNDRLTVKDGETIGPYNCSADCNPPCSITWKLKDTDVNLTDALLKGTTELSQQIVNRNMSLFSCEARYGQNDSQKYDISLNVLYLDRPSVFISGQQILNENKTLQIAERKTIHLSCFVNSEPHPDIQLRQNGKNLVTNRSNTQWLNHTMEFPQCSDSGTYKCVGISNGFNNTEKTFGINVTCKPSIDGGIKSLYGSRSGRNITVAVPVIGNPPPQESNITWSGPMGNLSIKSTVSQRDVPYKHWINSSIPIKNQSYFGNYTLKYNGDDITTIIINAEVQPSPSSKTSNMKIIVIGVSVALAVILLVIAVIVTWCLMNRRKTKRRSESSLVVAGEGNEPDVVMYAAVEKNHKTPTENKVDVIEDDVIATERSTDEQDALYASTEKENPVISKPSRVKKAKGLKKEVLEQRNQEDNVPSADPSTGKFNTSNTNKDGLIYIEVGFTNKPENRDINEQSLIHGEEDRTEYTFVDFSKKAPPLQENEEDQ